METKLQNIQRRKDSIQREIERQVNLHGNVPFDISRNLMKALEDIKHEERELESRESNRRSGLI